MMRTPPSSSNQAIIAMNDPDVMMLWADRFGIDLDELREVVELVGPDAGRVQEELTGIPAIRH